MNSDNDSDICSSDDSERDQKWRKMAHMAALAVSSIITTTAESLYDKQGYHTSALSGADWVRELLDGHPERIRNELGVHKHILYALVDDLKLAGLANSKHIFLEEQVAIFLYTCVTGLSLRHVGERFQHSGETISKYFTMILIAFSSAPFYTKHVQLPNDLLPVPPKIQNNPKFFPFFKDAIGAIDGTHINCTPSATDRQSARDRKGTITQNCLAICSFDMNFFYIFSGWDGSAADSTMFYDARVTDLPIVQGKYYLADAGFPICDTLLIPYRGVRYHLAEWGSAQLRPTNKEELFNLRHASARNVIERIFGVLKRRFKILVYPPEISMNLQARLPAALAAIHNFIRDFDPDDLHDFEEAEDIQPGWRSGELANGLPDQVERNRTNDRREGIANDMWAQYQQYTIGAEMDI